MIFASAQSTAASPRIDQWHGLRLGSSTPEEAVQAFGKPETDDKRADAHFEPIWGTSGLYKLVMPTPGERLRRQRFAHKRAVPGFESVELTYLNDKLVCISLEPEAAIPFAEILKTYGLELQLWNLSRNDQFLGPLQLDEQPTGAQPTGESGPDSLLRTFYATACQDGNVLGARGSTLTTARKGIVTRLLLISPRYVHPREISARPKTETILK